MPLTKPGQPRQHRVPQAHLSHATWLEASGQDLTIRAQECPWQLCGSKGPDVSFAFLGEACARQTW